MAAPAQKKLQASSPSALTSLPPIMSASFTTAGLMFPMDLVRAIRMGSPGTSSTFSLLGDFHAKYGLRGFFTQGVVPEVMRAGYMRCLKFFLFPVTFQHMWSKPASQGKPYEKALAGALCAIPEAMTMMPLELAKVGLQLDRANRFQNSSIAVVQHLRSAFGVRGLWIGYAGVQWRQSSWTAVYFGTLSTYQSIVTSLFGKFMSDSESPAMTKVARFLAGFSAGVTGAIFNVPGDLIRTNVQKRALEALNAGQKPHIANPLFAFGELFTVGGELVARGGPGALWTGFFWKAVHLGGSGALMAILLPFFNSVFF